MINEILDIFYPRNCVVCGGAVEGEGWYLCDACFKGVEIVGDPYCDSCGYPFWGKVEYEQRCPHCSDAEVERFFRKGRTGFLLKGAGRDLVHEIKYNRGLFLKKDIVNIIKKIPSLLDFVEGAIVVPVPLHSRKKRERGFNQSEWIAGIFRELGNDVRVENLLVRIEDTPTQTSLDRKKRYNNVKNAFALFEKSIITPTHHYIILDDVFTTGATLNACAKVLVKGGANWVDILTLGHG